MLNIMPIKFLFVFLFIGVQSVAIANEQIKYQMATFAGGCFWCMEKPFEDIQGVSSVISGYMGGHVVNPSYELVSSGTSGHKEVVTVKFDPQKTSYAKLLEVFWQNIDPTDRGGQFVDRGTQYSSAIFYYDEEQKNLAEKSKTILNESKIFDKPITTEIIPAATFYPAEEYHQDYYKNNPLRYKYYRYNSGRDQFLDKKWQGKSSQINDLLQPGSKMKAKEALTPLQQKVIKENGTEPPFNNEYWDNKEVGIYVDRVSGAPLFLSIDKFDSGTGWPSFTKPISAEAVVEKEDNGLFMTRTEIRSKKSDSHLGHVFDDGPAPTGKRYCMNSAALKFIPLNKMKEAGYEAYIEQLKK